jgi:hypothetical protein
MKLLGFINRCARKNHRWTRRGGAATKEDGKTRLEEADYDYEDDDEDEHLRGLPTQHWP